MGAPDERREDGIVPEDGILNGGPDQKHAADHGPEDEQGPERRCIVTGARAPRDALLRFVASPDGDVVVDLDAKLPGRGLWVTPSREVVETAVRKGAFARAARRAVRVDSSLPARVEAILVDRLVDLIGFARRAGMAVCGYETVKARLHSGTASVLLSASDRDGDGPSRLRRASAAAGVRVVAALTSEELGRPFGRSDVVHALLSQGRLADHVVAGADRLLQYRPKGLAGGGPTDDGPTEIDAGAGVPAGVSNVDE